MLLGPVLRKPLKRVLIFFCAVAAIGNSQALAETPVCVYEQPELLTASIYARNSEPPKLLFRFRRNASRSGSTTIVLREYSYPDGRLAARERVRYEGNTLESYELEELQIGTSGTVTVNEASRDSGRISLAFTYGREADHKSHARTSTEKPGAEVLVNDMMGAFVSTNYARLERGAKLTCRYIVVSRRETVGLSFEKQSETTYHGCPVIILRVQPTSPLISILVSPLYFTVEKAPPHRVLQYIGLTTPKIGFDNHWKDLEGVTVFDW